MITNLYYNQGATEQIELRSTKEINIKRGVSQGYISSLTLFKLYSENITKDVFENENCGTILV